MAAVTHGAEFDTTANVTSPGTYPDTGTWSLTPANNDLLVAFVGAPGLDSTTCTITDTGTGGTWTQIRQQAKSASTDQCWLLVRDTLSDGSAINLTVGFSGGSDNNATGCIVQVARVSGMTAVGSAAVEQSSGRSNQASGGTPDAVFSASCSTNNPTLGAVYNGSNPAGTTPPTDWTELNDDGHASPASGMSYVSRNSGFTGTTITWGATTGSAYAVMIVELDAGGGGGAVTSGNLLLLGVG